MATTFQDFIQMFVRKLRGEDQEEELLIDYVSVSIVCGIFLWVNGVRVSVFCACGWLYLNIVLLLFFTQATKDVNNMTVKMPNQCFINGKFEDSENGKTYDTINPTDGSVS